MMLFPQPRFLYPPRTEHVSSAKELPNYDNGSFLAQVKYNGDAIVVVLNPTSMQVFNRYGVEYTKMKLGGLDSHFLYKGTGVMVLCGEYLSKNKTGELGESLNHRFIIWDILVFDSNYLIGHTFESRLELLENLYPSAHMMMRPGGVIESYEYLLCTANQSIYRAATFVADFSQLYDDVIKTDLYEGLVLKKRSAPLQFGYSEKNNSGWQLKFRKRTKNYLI